MIELLPFLPLFLVIAITVSVSNYQNLVKKEDLKVLKTVKILGYSYILTWFLGISYFLIVMTFSQDVLTKINFSNYLEVFISLNYFCYVVPISQAFLMYKVLKNYNVKFLEYLFAK